MKKYKKIKILLSVVLFVVMQFVFLDTLHAQVQPESKPTSSESSQIQDPQIKSESEIPVFKNKDEKAPAAKSTSSQILMSVIVVLSLVGASIVLIKKYAYKNRPSKNQPKIKVLTQHHLGPKKSLAIIHVAGESILIGITDHNVNLIKSLALIDDEVPSDLEQNFEENIKDEAKEQFSFSAMGKGKSARTKEVSKSKLEFSETLDHEMRNL